MTYKKKKKKTLSEFLHMSDGPEPKPAKIPGSAHVSFMTLYLLIFYDPLLLHQ